MPEPLSPDQTLEDYIDMVAGLKRRENHLKFNELASIVRDIAPILDRQVPSLARYYNNEKYSTMGFSHLVSDKKRSRASTATCIAALVATDSWAVDWRRKGDSATPWASDRSAIAQVLLTEEWESSGLPVDNVFTTSFILDAASRLLAGTTLDGKLNQQIKRAQEVILTGSKPAEDGTRACEGLEHGPARVFQYRPSAYLTQLAVRALQISSTLPDCSISDLDGKLKVTQFWARRELAEQLALKAAGNRSADVFELAYAALLVAQLSEGRRLAPADATLVRAGLATFFGSQLPNGTWPRSLPLFHYPSVGAAFCFEYELLVQLLECEQLWGDLLSFLPQLTLATRYALETGYPLGGDAVGWSSGHHRHIDYPESWSTASVYHFLHGMDRLVCEAIRREVFSALDQVYRPPGEPSSAAFASGMLDCPSQAGEPSTSLKKDLEEFFAAPVKADRVRVHRGRPMSAEVPTSALFFGPPGTSKTDLAVHLAMYLGWPLLRVDPSHFVKSGMDLLQAEADRIFQMLAHLEEVVVLLDEIDELVRDRGQSSEMLSRFLTTSMLPKLSRLQERRRIVWIVATNYIEKFDLAIRRPGRFDVVVPVLPPKTSEKLDRWPELKAAVETQPDRESLESKIADLTFLETRAVVKILKATREPAAARTALEDAFATCTLNSREGHGDAAAVESKSWREIALSHRNKRRLGS